jgi:2-dehydro-3-deoxygalactonokinase
MARNDLTVFGDWGTSRLRLVLFDGDERLGEAEGPGIGALPGSAREALLNTLAPWRERHALGRVVLCGMAGSRTGVVEASYASCPASAVDWARQAVEISLDGLAINVAPGVAGLAPNGAPDVMRGEEAQVFGALALRPDLARGEQMFVLPGTHSKWCHVRDGRILGFHTFLTGELFALLSTRSSLLLGATGSEDAETHEAGFAASLSRARDTRLLGAVFEARAAQLRADRSGDWAIGFLSGLLVGSELVEALAAHNAASLTLVGAPLLLQRYLAALQAYSIEVETMSGEDCVLAGLQLLFETRPRT